MKFILEEYHNKISDEELITDMIRVSCKLSKETLSASEYTIHGDYSKTTIVNRFGNWNEALKKAGLKATKEFTLTKQDLFNNMEQVWEKFGRQPRYDEMTKDISKYSGNVYYHRFGGWKIALREFVEYKNGGKLSEWEIKPPPKRCPLKIISHKTQRKIKLRMRFDILERDGYRCVKCGSSPANERGVKLEIDHIKPWSKGGETIPENLQTLCKKCNTGKSNRY
jgi:hypothetical protein